jgi:hypothetical protein
MLSLITLKFEDVGGSAFETRIWEKWKLLGDSVCRYVGFILYRIGGYVTEKSGSPCP